MPLLTDEEMGGGFLPRVATPAPQPEDDGSMSTGAKLATGAALVGGMALAPGLTLGGMALAGAGSLLYDGEGAAAAFRTENTIGSALASKSAGADRRVDEAYDNWADIAGTPYEQHWDKFTDVFNKDHADAVKADIDRETKDRAYLESQGAVGFAQAMAAGLFDVTSLLPGGAAVRSARGNYSALRSAISVGAYGAAGAAITEGALQATQQTRTLEESAAAIAGSTVLAGVLGAGIARRMSRAEMDALGDKLAGDINRSPDDPAPAMASQPSPDKPSPDGEALLAPKTEGILVAHGEDTDALTQELKSVAERILPESVRLQVVESLEAGGAKAKDDALYGIRAYHGTPHDVDRFSTEKIGEGEGAQTFGHGLYFAENKSVAETYAHALARDDVYLDGEPVYVGGKLVKTTGNEAVDNALVSERGNLTRAAGSLMQMARFYRQQGDHVRADQMRAQVDELDKFRERAELRTASNLYEVDLDVAPEQLLDWDAPLTKQGPAVQAAIRKLGIEPVEYRNGQWLHDELFRREQGGYDAVAKALREAGIPGIRYLDQDSRISGPNPTRNIVIFDDSLVKIAAKNGEPVTAAQREKLVDEMMGGGAADPSKPRTQTEVKVFHGTGSGAIERFDPDLSSTDGAIFFTRQPAAASAYAGRDGDLTVYPTYLETKGFKEVDFGGKDYMPDVDEGGSAFDALIFQAKEEGFPGLIVKNVRDVGGLQDQYITWTPGTVRSATSGQEMFSVRKGGDVTETPEFKRWFGDSKVVDEAGRPLVVYHGGKAGVEQFVNPQVAAKDFLTPEAQANVVDAAFFTKDERVARSYRKRIDDRAFRASDPAGAIYKVYLSIKNPLEIDMKGAKYNPGDVDGQIQAARAGGHDGMIVRNIVDDFEHKQKPTTVYVTFEPTQIKSVNNKGTFDPSDPRINNAIRGTTVEGKYDPAQNLITIARAALDPVSTLHHEAVHALKNMGLFTPREWKALENAAKTKGWMTAPEMATYAKLYDAAKGDPRLTEEAIAMAYQRWISGTEPQKGVLGSAFARVRKFLDSIKTALTGKGFATPEDIFARIDSGAVAARARQAEGKARGAAGARSAGAAAVDRGGFELKSAMGMEKALAGLAPGLHLQNSPSSKTRGLANELFESALQMKDHADWVVSGQLGAEAGEPGAVETRIKLWQTNLAKGFVELDNAFMAYRKGTEKRRTGDLAVTSLSDFTLGSGGKLDYRQFREEVSKAMRSGDDHPIKEVARAAKFLRATVYDPLLKRAIELGMLPEGVGDDVKTAMSYVNRMYNRKKIIAERDQFKSVVKTWLAETETQNAAVRGRLAPLLGEVSSNEKRVKALEPRITKREQKLKELEKAAEEVKRFHKFAFERALKGREPVDAVRERVSAAAERLAEPLERLATLKDASKEVRDALALLRSSRADAKKGLDLADELADVAEVEEALRAIRADEVEAKADLAAIQTAQQQLKAEIDPFRKQLSALKREEGRKVRTETVRAAERGTFATKARNRGEALTDRIAGTKAKVEEMKLEVEERAARINTARKLIEEQVTRYQGKTAKQATAALEARARAEVARGEDQPRLKAADKPVMEAAEKIAAQSPKDANELDDLAEQIIDRVIGTPEGRLPYDAHLNKGQASGFKGIDMDLRGPMQARVFMIPDERIAPWLENDIDLLMRAYTHTMSADAELAARFGSPDMVLAFKEINEQYAQMAKGMKPGERLKLYRRRDLDFINLAAIRDRLRGTYKLPDDPDAIHVRAVRVAMTLNYMRLLGGQTVSALPDMANIVMRNGVGALFQDIFVPLVRNVSGLKKASDEAKWLSGALEMVNDTRALRLADITDPYMQGTKFERGLASASRNFGMVSLMAPWNAVMKQIAGYTAMSRILRNAQTVAKGDGLKRGEIEFMAGLGITEDAARRIGEQFAKHGVKRKGVNFANTANWDEGSRSAIEALRVALRKSMDVTIVTPGVAEKPKMASTLTGAMLLQFKSFAFSATQRVLLANLQQRDAAVISGALLSLSLGALVTMLKQPGDEKKRKKYGPQDWQQLLGESIDRSGMLGILMEANAITEKVTDGRLGMSALTGKPISRYASRNLTSSLLGPTFGLAEQGFGAVNTALGRDPVTQKDLHAARQLIPFQNLLGLRKAFDAAEKGMVDAFGIPERAPARAN